MNKTTRMLLPLFAATLSLAAASAQPTLTAATNAPVAGETFYGHICNTAGVAVGASGAGATWDFSTLAQTGLDTTSYVSCSSTPYCDSFPGSNLALRSGSSYVYFTTSAGSMVENGSYLPGFGYQHLSDPQEIMFYPVTYSFSHADAAAAIIPASPATLYLSFRETTTADAWGTLIVPGGTYTNVLRLHRVTVTRDSFVTSGFPAVVDSSRNESYNWFVSGIHSPVLTIDLDTTGSGTLHVTDVTYTNTAPTAIQNIALAQDALQVYPDPAVDVVNMKFTLRNAPASSIIITDLAGRKIADIGGDTFISGLNNISYPVTGLPDGIYLVRLRTEEGTITKKLIVHH